MDTGLKSLRCQDIQKAISINIGSDHPLLTYIHNPIKIGACAVILNNIKGLDVIDYIKFRGIVAYKFKINASLFEEAVRVLEEVELVSVVNNDRGQKWKIYDKSKMFSDNYNVLDKYFNEQCDTEIERAFVDILLELSSSPLLLKDYLKKYNLLQEEQQILMAVGKQSEILQFSEVPGEEAIIHTPLYWENNANQIPKIMDSINNDDIKKAIELVKSYQGYPIDESEDINVKKAISLGILPTPSLEADGNIKRFVFTPYAGSILIDKSEKSILEKARNLLTAVRYGQHYSQYPIRNPLFILNTLKSRGDNYTLNATTVAKEQYKDLAVQGMGQLIHSGGNWHKFQMFDTAENLKAVDLAIDMIRHGEQITNKGREENISQLITGGNTINEFFAIKETKKTVDMKEIAECINVLQGAYYFNART
ncbi:hypothetical protein [Bacillus thuringiensis]|uniref:hypothetical protein n=1 Tax=Bacillus thuringiensis TaxID=1428 RepID=UPI000BF25A48|nr:hypothetical protein [Bacillus thuringiensis]PEV71263.1 hypothetical protein CN434_05170 [Bacillus thuringiensis]PGO92189.1 hypothetical protein CN990_02595 [Bacillus thuringiensis]